MSSKTSVAFAIYIIFSVALKEVSSWTIDLPEARKFYFEKYGQSNKNEKVNKAKSVKTEDDKKFYDNIEPNSPYNSENYEPNLKEYEERVNHEETDDDNDIYHGRYADDYDYQSYMEKKVNGIVHNGSVYLEGLRRALDRYSELLKNCSKMADSTTDANESTQNTTWLPENEQPSPSLPSGSRDMTCSRATRASEHVRRLAELALWATRELQDRAYADKYQDHQEEDEEEEKELLLRLAWFLDRLAVLTGFEPDPKDFITDKPPTGASPPATTPPAVPAACNPTTDNCRFPLSMPASSTTTTASSKAEQQQRPTESTPATSSSAELLKPSETRHRSKLPPNQLSTVRSVHKRSVDDNPLLHVIKYYSKYKVWANSNPGSELSENSEEFHVPNDLVVKVIKKRAIDNKKAKHFQLPQDPMQDISKHSKQKPGLRYAHDKIQAEKIRKFLKKIRMHSLKNKSVQKRSVGYEKMFLPRIPQDPQQDLSYYVKNKPGTERQYNLVQAGQVRAGLEQVFQTGNLEVVRRFGMNYNPAIPSPLMAGVMKSFVDS